MSATATLSAVGPFVIDTTHSKLTLTEDKERKGKWILRGLFGRYGVPTNNGRLYTESVMRRNLERLTEDVQSRRVFGELDHPADGRTKLSRVSHLITGLALGPDNEILGEAEILNTEAGRNLKALLEAECMVGVSSRGIGTTSPDSRGNKVVNEDYKLLTFDIVAEPANAGAHPSFFIEGKEATPADVTKDSIRAAFPDLFREIELEAAAVATQMMAERQTEGTASREQIEKELRDEFTAKLATELSRVKAEAEQAAERIEGDSHASTAQVVKLTETVKAMEAERNALKDQMNELEELAKNLGYKYRLSQRLELVSEEYRDDVAELVGDPTDYDTLDDLDEAVDDAIKAVEERSQQEIEEVEEARKIAAKVAKNVEQDVRRRVAEDAEPLVREVKKSRRALRQRASAVAEAAGNVVQGAEVLTEAQQQLATLKEELDREIRRRKQGEREMKNVFRKTLSEMEGEVDNLRQEKAELEARLGRAVMIGEELEAEAHAERRMARRTDAPRMRRLLRRMKPRGREEVDTLFEEVAEPRRRRDMEEIKRHVSRKGRGRLLAESHDERGSGGEVMGLSMAEMARLAGITKPED